MTDEQAIRELIVAHYEQVGVDEDAVHQIYTDDAVLEFPQSGERFRGRQNILGFRKAYPAAVRLAPHRIRGRSDLWLIESTITYDGVPQHSVSIMEFRDDKVALETVYVMQGFDAPDWREPWREAP